MIENGIAVIGSTTIDKIVRRNLSRYKIGGVTTYAGITYRRHGIKTVAVTNIAKRHPEVIARLMKEKIKVCSEQTEETTHFINSIDDDIRQQKILRLAATINRQQVAANIKGIGVVHLGPLHPADIDIQAIEFLSKKDNRIILDVQGLVRSVKNKVVYTSVSKHLNAALRWAHIVKANAQEFESMSDYYQMDLSQLMHRFKIKEFLVTAGSKGGCVQEISGEEIRYMASIPRTKGDPTGAGDIFLAAYVIGRMLNRQKIPDACKYAAKLVSRQIDDNYLKLESLDPGHIDSCKRG